MSQFNKDIHIAPTFYYKKNDVASTTLEAWALLICILFIWLLRFQTKETRFNSNADKKSFTLTKSYGVSSV